MPEVKKKIRLKRVDESIIEMFVETVQILNDGIGLRNKKIVNNLIDSFAEVLIDMPEFHKLLANPKTDLTGFEIVIKKMLKNKKKKK